MITLQVPPRRGDLKSFWLVMSITVGLLVGVLASLLMSPRWFLLGVIVVLLLAFPGLLRPQIASIPYRVWNKLAREFARYGSLWLMYICYYVIFVAVGRSGSLLRLTRPGADTSMWMLREAHTKTKRYDSNGVTIEESSCRSWVAVFLSSAIKSGNWWACCLLPFLILLSILKSDTEESDFPTGIYTLF